jgi:hypothetical protein
MLLDVSFRCMILKTEHFILSYLSSKCLLFYDLLMTVKNGSHLENFCLFSQTRSYL